MKLIIYILIMIMSFEYNNNTLIQIRKQPHLLGHMVSETKLTELHSKWIKDVWENNKPLMAHRGAYKTTAVTQIGPVWWLLFHPNDRIAIYRKPYTEAANILNTIRKYFELEQIIKLFTFAHKKEPRFIRKKESVLTFNFKKKITKEGSINAYGIEKIRTGTHFEKAICDDFVVLEDRISKATRDKTKEPIRELITNIMDPGQHAGFVGTPWHKDDAWQLVPNPKKYTNKQTKILTKKELEEKKSKTTAQLFAINYELKHISSDDAIFKDPVYGKWDYTLPSVYGHLDAKYKGDHTNGLTFMAKREDGRFQITGYTWPEHIDEHIKDVAELYQKRRCCKLWNEENADKGYLAKDLKKEGMKVDTYSEHWHKHTKIVTFLKAHWNDLVFDENIQPEYMNQVLDYMEGQEPDDCPDSASSLLRMAYFPDADYEDYW
jgi:hypothetical protein